MSELKNLLLEYKNINDKLIDILSQDLEDSNYDELQPLLSERQQVINSINLLNYTTEEFSTISK
ncbi:MAG TPA: flagellar protein FliT, partial [Clostridium sp.]|nr:flagellar protein FliT [Clostridium sp.]